MAKRRRGGKRGTSDIISTRDLVSDRERNKALVDETLGVFENVFNDYGVIVNQIQLAKMGPKDAGTMAYYDGSNIAVNETYFDKKAMETAYSLSVKSGFHPSSGNKTGLEATVAHEIGHRLTDAVGVKMGNKEWADFDTTAKKIVEEARKKTKHKGVIQMAEAISGYATYSNAEAIAEAFSDVYCNGTKARAESQAIVEVMNKYLK